MKQFNALVSPAWKSEHTEAIVCAEKYLAAEEFLRCVYAVCVLKNASTRFADGFRFDLGAEEGVSSGWIHDTQNCNYIKV